MRNLNKQFLATLFTFLSLASAIHVSLAADYIPSEQILLNCGEPSILNDEDKRSWAPDIGSKFLLSTKDSATSKAPTQDPSTPTIPFMTARVFPSEFTYSFPVVAGRKFVRLYFYPNSYNGLNATDARFSVSTGPYTLLKNFSVTQTAEALNYAYVIKEYAVPVDGETLNITFSPMNVSNAYAFVNGIEVMSMPDIYRNTDGNLMIVGQTSPIYIGNTIALENVYRLNVGGKAISPSGDTGLFRSWNDDEPYIFGAAFGVPVTIGSNMAVRYPNNIPSYVAPVDVYSTGRSMGPDSRINLNYNLSWVFSVDSGFSYLVRLHFCEVSPQITKINQRVFDIFLNNQTAVSGFDVAGWTNGNGVPSYQDFAVLVPGNGQQKDLWLQLHPNPRAKPQYYDAILNGVEIFKLSDASSNLAQVLLT